MSASDSNSAKAPVEVTEKPGNVSDGGLDSAWKYLDNHRDVDTSDLGVDINSLRRKIDWRIVPLMFLAYTLQFLDKVILNVSS
jgi:type IV secretory pathway TrbL component